MAIDADITTKVSGDIAINTDSLAMNTSDNITAVADLDIAPVTAGTTIGLGAKIGTTFRFACVN